MLKHLFINVLSQAKPLNQVTQYQLKESRHGILLISLAIRNNYLSDFDNISPIIRCLKCIIIYIVPIAIR